jgi:hypothetical protein
LVGAFAQAGSDWVEDDVAADVGELLVVLELHPAGDPLDRRPEDEVGWLVIGHTVCISQAYLLTAAAKSETNVRLSSRSR